MRPGTVFYKMSGSGNDFLMFDGRYAHREDFTPKAVQAICDRRQGAGADGVIVLDPEAPQGANFTFRFWNSDGSDGPMCGNGALCATRLAALLELAPASGEVVFATPAGLHRGRVGPGEARPTIYLPDCELPKPAKGIKLAGGEKSAHLANPSVPHLVLMVDDVGSVPLESRGALLRKDPATGEAGANVNWVAPAKGGGFRMRTFERGVEGETLACGTGAVASALVLAVLGAAKPPVRLWTTSGLPLDVGFVPNGSKATALTLTGEGRLVFRGIVAEPASQ